MARMSVFFVICMLAADVRTGLAASATDVRRASAPVLELTLAPPRQPQPQVVAELALLDTARDKLEARFMNTLQNTYDGALVDAKLRIDSLIRRFLDAPNFDAIQRSGFLRAAESFSTVGALRIQAKVFPVPPADPQIETRIDDMERKLSALEEQILQKACDDLPHVTDLVLSELGHELHKTVHAKTARQQQSFLELAPMANVRVASSSKAFPTVRSLVEKMERHRDNAESAALSHAIEMEAKLLAAEIEYVTQRLRVVVAK
jgi:hypothetical protein